MLNEQINKLKPLMIRYDSYNCHIRLKANVCRLTIKRTIKRFRLKMAMEVTQES